MGSTPIDVFLTYDDRDADLARDVRAAVKAAGMSCWAEGVDLVPGELWDEVIPARLSAARVMAVLITQHWPEAGQRNTDWYGPEKVALAIDQARSRSGHPMIVPVLLRGGTVARVPFGIRRAARVQLTETDLARLAAELKRTVAAEAGRPAPESPETIRGVEVDAARARQLTDAGERADVVIVTALKVELDALMTQSGVEWTRGTGPRGFPYEAATVDGLRIIAARTGGAGEQHATARVVQLHDQFDPQVLAICGICAGHPDDTHLGDVIVADRVFDYDAGAYDADGIFSADYRTHDLRPQWRINAEDLAADRDGWLGALGDARPRSLRWLRDTALWRLHTDGVAERFADEHPSLRRKVWKALADTGLVGGRPPRVTLTEAGSARIDDMAWDDGPLDDAPLRAHIGPMATGKAVRRDAAVWQQVRGAQRKTLAVEMESTAIGAVAATHKLDFLAVKGVSDHADAAKDDRFHPFAARASAAFLLAFLRRHVEPRRRVSAESGAPDMPSAAPSSTPAFAPWFEAAELDEVVQAFIHYPLSRDLLLSWVDRGLVSSLPTGRNPAEQVRSDLETLNAQPGPEGGGDPPLVKWLEQAVRLAGPFPQARIYTRVLGELRARIARR